MNGDGSDKYLVVSKDFRKDAGNRLAESEPAVRFQVNEYVGHFPEGEDITADRLAHDSGIQKTAFLIM